MEQRGSYLKQGIGNRYLSFLCINHYLEIKKHTSLNARRCSSNSIGCFLWQWELIPTLTLTSRPATDRGRISNQLPIVRLVSLQPPQLGQRNTVLSRCSQWFDLSVPPPAAPADNRKLVLYSGWLWHTEQPFWASAASSWLSCSPKGPIGVPSRPAVLGQHFCLQIHFGLH